MKYAQIAAFCFLMVCVFAVSAQAQRTFTYMARSGDKEESRETVTIVIKEVKGGWAVSGQYSSGVVNCTISGSYYPSTGRLRAMCKGTLHEMTVTGIKLSGKDALQLTVGTETLAGGVLVAYRDGKKPVNETGAAKIDTCSMVGNWKQETPGIPFTQWTITADGTAKERGGGNVSGKASLSGRTLRIDWSHSNGWSGYYEWELEPDCKSGSGKLKFNSGRTDTVDNSTVKNM